ncbi:MAG: DUF2306 domain-containing protein [Candidatus Eremiobacteraeota bacterium]|nr:DUF2306 domain-containing protein [Candidatus Eremiobacteraeota bacterium]
MSVRTVARLWGWIFLTYAALYSAWGAFDYVTGPVEFYDFTFRAKYLAHLGTVWTHGVASVLALALGPFQFVSWLPQRAHRMLGWGYFACLFLGGLSGLAMGLWAYGGPVAQAGFVALAGGWLITSGMACYTILKRRFHDHRAWAIRSYALTFSAVNIRLALYWLEYLELPFEVIYPWTAWGAWLITLGLAEWLLVRRRFSEERIRTAHASKMHSL